MPDGSTTIDCSVMFQSAPGREAGRCHHHLVWCCLGNVFQSAPGREAGRCQRQPVNFKRAGVSIRARP